MKKDKGGVNHPKYQNLTGQKIGKLFVVQYVNKILKNGIAKWVWECNCDCGQTIYVRTSRLNGVETNQENCQKCQGKINSQKRILSDYQSIKNNVFSVYRKKALSKGLNFDLTFDNFQNMIVQNCYYCGQEPEIHNTDLYKLHESEPFKRNGIDRINSSEGYSDSNCVPCCTMCNFAKLHYSLENFSLWLKRVYNYQKLNNNLKIF